MIKYIFPAMVLVLIFLFFIAKKLKPKMDALKAAETNYIDSLEKYRHQAISKDELERAAEALLEIKGLPKEEAQSMLESDLKIQGIS